MNTRDIYDLPYTTLMKYNQFRSEIHTEKKERKVQEKKTQ